MTPPQKKNQKKKTKKTKTKTKIIKIKIKNIKKHTNNKTDLVISFLNLKAYNVTYTVLSY